MSLCDSCKSPGHCCRQIRLYGRGMESPDLSDADAVEALLEIEHDEASNAGWLLPFVIVGRDESGQIVYTCPALGVNGRCTVYDRRPSICRKFEPASSPLCVHYTEPTS
jgi:Fe-S-cluster containining protein